MMIRGERVRASVLTALAGVLFFAPALVASDGPQRADPHAHFQNPDQCMKCHLPSGSQPHPGRFVGEPDVTCLGCHPRENMGRSHPLGVRPDERFRKMKVPADLPLDEDGHIMCLTCHTAHRPYAPYILRRSSPDGGFEALCEACHGKQ